MPSPPKGLRAPSVLFRQPPALAQRQASIIEKSIEERSCAAFPSAEDISSFPSRSVSASHLVLVTPPRSSRPPDRSMTLHRQKRPVLLMAPLEDGGAACGGGPLPKRRRLNVQPVEPRPSPPSISASQTYAYDSSVFFDVSPPRPRRSVAQHLPWEKLLNILAPLATATAIETRSRSIEEEIEEEGLDSSPPPAIDSSPISQSRQEFTPLRPLLLPRPSDPLDRALSPSPDRPASPSQPLLRSARCTDPVSTFTHSLQIAPSNPRPALRSALRSSSNAQGSSLVRRGKSVVFAAEDEVEAWNRFSVSKAAERAEMNSSTLESCLYPPATLIV